MIFGLKEDFKLKLLKYDAQHLKKLSFKHSAYIFYIIADWELKLVWIGKNFFVISEKLNFCCPKFWKWHNWPLANSFFAKFEEVLKRSGS